MNSGSSNGPSRASARRAFEERRRRRSLAIATASTVAFLLLVVLLVPRMPRWDRVKQSFFSGEQFADSFPRLLEAFWLDVKIFAWSVPVILGFGMLVALTRVSRNPALFPIRALCIVYVDLMRGVPVLLWIYLIGFGIPGLGLERHGTAPSSGAPSRFASPTRVTSPRCSARASKAFTKVSGPPRGRSASPTARHSGSSSSPRRCDGSFRHS